MNQEGSEDRRAGKVFELRGLVEYQNGSVVSRQLIRKEAGNVTLFAFDEGEGLSEHTAPFDALVYVIEGEAGVIISGTAHTVGAGQMIIMPAGEPHALKAKMRFKMMLTMVRSR